MTVDMTGYDDTFLKCKALAHAWEPLVTYIEREGRAGVNRMVLICERERAAGVPDASEKEQTTFAKGKRRGQLIESPKYRYPQGYKSVGVGRGHWKHEARAELADRIATTNVVSMKRKGA